MKDQNKTKEQLIKELAELRQRIAELQTSETQLKRMEEALRESRETARALLNAPTDVAALLDTEGFIVDASEAMAQRFGKRVDEFIGLYGWDLLPPDLAERRKAYADQVIRSGEPLRFEDERQGTWFDNVFYPVLDAQGKVTKVAILARDITERKQAEETLKGYSERLEAMVGERTTELQEAQEQTARSHRLLLALSQAAQAVQRARTPEEVYQTVGDELADLGYHALILALTADQTHLMFAHQTFESPVLRAAEKLTGLSTQDFRVPFLPGGFHDQVISEGRTLFAQNIVERIGETIPKLARPLAERVLSMLRVEQGIYAPLTVGEEPHGMLVVTGTGLTEADVPTVTAFANQTSIALENAWAQEILQKSEQWLSATLRSIGDAVIATDAQGLVSLMNPVAEALTGWDEAEAVDKPLEEVFHIVNEQTGEQAENPAARALREGVVVGLANHTLLIAKDGTKRPIADSGAPMKDQAGDIIGTVMVFRDITERRRAEAEREATYRKYQSLIRALGEVTYEHLVPEGIINWSRAFEQILGYTESEMGNDERSWLDRVHPDDLPGVESEFERAFRENHLYDLEYRFRHKSGEYLWMHDRGVMQAGEDGELATVIGIMKNISERKRAEEALKRRVTELAALNAMATIVNQSLEVDEILEQAIVQALRLVGVEAAAMMLLDEEAGELVMTAHQGISDEFAQVFNRMKLGEGLSGRVAQTGQPAVLRDLAEYPEARRSYLAEERIQSAAFVPLIGRTGVIGTMNLGTDRTYYFDAAGVDLLVGLGRQIAAGVEKARLHQALREREERYRQVVENLHEGIWVIDKDAYTTFVNPRMAEMLGYTVDGMLGKHLFEFMDERGVEIAERNLERRKQGIKEQHEFEFLRKDGTRIYASLETAPITDDDGDYIGAIAGVSDITELKEMHEQLIRREKLAVLGQLAGGVGHDLRNPLGAIKNAAYFLNMVLEEPDPEVKETLEILDKEVGTCERIISGLLDFARAKPPMRRKVDVNELAQEALSCAVVPDNVEVVSQLDETLPTILADPDQLAQVFGNIILNAVQAMPEGGRLVVKTWQVLPKPARSGQVAVSFSDTGVGIPEENVDKLFEPLFTTRAKGIGLGLALVKTLVGGHGGSIEVESEVGKGSTFTVRLPLTGAPES